MGPRMLSSLALTLPETTDVPVEYRPLHKYLVERYATTVVLTFAEVADLVGFALPDEARLQADWWADPRADGTRSPQSRAWTAARRGSMPNLIAQKVTFVSIS